MTTPTANTNTAPDWTTLVDTYNSLQQQAYKDQSVQTSQVTALKADIEAYVTANVTDTTQQKTMLASFDTDLTAMSTATDLKASSGATSNASWDSSRTDLESLLGELAPTGGTTVWTPTAATSLAPTTGSLLATPTTGTSSTGGAAGMLGSMNMVSLDDMITAFPQLAPYKSAFLSASAQYNIPAQLLAAQAMEESHGDPSTGNGGMMQFIPDTWNTYGDPSVPYGSFSAANAPQQIAAAAKYDAELMNNSGGNLEQAMRGYNGPVADGGNSAYATQIGKWMAGQDGYGS